MRSSIMVLSQQPHMSVLHLKDWGKEMITLKTVKNVQVLHVDVFLDYPLFLVLRFSKWESSDLICSPDHSQLYQIES